MLALLGPCRADGVGGGQGYEDLRGLDGVDADALHETHTSRSLVSALGALRDAVAEASRASRDPAWADVGLCAPPVRFAMCSWWPDLVLPTVAATVAAPGATAAPAAPPRSDAPDRAWLDPERADEALARLARSAARLPTADAAPSDPAEWATMTNPAGAAARASSLWREPAAAAAAVAVADVAWITAAVDGGGGGDGEWPPEAVAAYGVMRAAVDAGARAVVVVLQEDEDGDEKSSSIRRRKRRRKRRHISRRAASRGRRPPRRRGRSRLQRREESPRRFGSLGARRDESAGWSSSWEAFPHFEGVANFLRPRREMARVAEDSPRRPPRGEPPRRRRFGGSPPLGRSERSRADIGALVPRADPHPRRAGGDGPDRLGLGRFCFIGRGGVLRARVVRDVRVDASARRRVRVRPRRRGVFGDGSDGVGSLGPPHARRSRESAPGAAGEAPRRTEGA